MTLTMANPRLLVVAFIVVVLNVLPTTGRRRPHIVIIMADDLGFYDVGYKNPEVHTPNIDKMAAEGVKLKYSYMNQVCTPSRAAFMTGIYPFRMGLQNSVLAALQNASLPLGYTMLPEHLQSLGYKTHYVGKWHLGFCNYDMTPTRRGFDTFYGMYTGKSTYYTHISKFKGYDFHDDVGPDPQNYRVATEAKGQYSTTLFSKRAVEIVKNHQKSNPLFLFLSYQAVHGPLEVPDQYLSLCQNIADNKTRLHCAMAAAMDEGIGELRETLDKEKLSNNLITVFMSDNGGAVKEGSSNWPLRGSKITLWEGGTRVVTILHSKKYLPDAPYEWDGLMHGVDWYPTLVRAAKDKGGVPGIDGVDNWKSITKNKGSARSSFVYNIDDVKNTSALRYNQYKLINNKPGSPDGWYNPPDGRSDVEAPSRHYPKYMLFDIDQDPEEKRDLSGQESFRDIMGNMTKMLDDFKKGINPSQPASKVDGGKPKYHNGNWVSGWC